MASGLLLKTTKKVLPYLLIVSIAVFMMYDIFQPGILTKSDNAVHMVEASFLANTAFPKYHWINSWYQNESGGMPLQLYFYQFSYWIMLLAHFLFSIPLELAYKLTLVFASAFPALALYFLLSKKFGRVAAFFPSLFYLFQIDNTKMFLAGMWNNGIGLGFLICLFYLLDKYRENMSFSSATAVGFVFGAIILSHYFVAIAAVCMFLAFLLASRENFFKNLSFYAFAFAFGGALTLFYTYPFIETSGWLAFDIGWGLGNSVPAVIYALFGIFFSLKPLLPAVQQAISANYLVAAKEFVFGFLQNLPMLAANALALLGLAYFVKNNKNSQRVFESQSRIKAHDSTRDRDKSHEERGFLKAALIFVFLSLILGSGFWFLIPSLAKAPFLSSILAYRFLYYGRIGLIVFAAFAISQIWKKAELPDYLQKLKIVFKYKNRLALSFVILFLVLLFSGLFFPPKDFTETSGEYALTGELQETIGWLSENLAGPTERVLFQSFFGNIKDSALPVYFIYQHNIPSFGAWATTQSPVQLATTTEEGRMFGKFVSNTSPEEIFEKSNAYNINYIVAVEPKLQGKLANSEYFNLEKKFEHFEIFSTKGFASEFVESENSLDYTITDFGGQEILIVVSNNYENNKASIKITHHPYWHAFANGKEIGLRANEFGLIGANLPAGNYELKLLYKPAKLLWPSFAALLLAAGLLLTGRWRTKRI